MTEKEPINYPMNIPLEQLVLGNLFCHNSLLFKINSFLKPEHFSQGIHGRIYQAIASRITEGGAVTALTISRQFDDDEELKSIGGGQYLSRLMSTGLTGLAIVSNAEELLALAKRRRLIDLAQEVLADAQVVTDDDPVEAIESRLLNGVNAVINDATTKHFQSSREVFTEIVEDFKKTPLCYSTGIDALDESMQGGLHARRMYSIAGRMKDGKTIMACTLAYNLAKRETKILFLSCEMENKELGKRMMARGMNMKSGVFFYDRNSEIVVGRAAQVMANEKRGILNFCYAPDLTLDSLKSRLYQAVHRFGIKGFILDQWQLVGGKKSRDTEAAHLSEVAQWIAAFCKREDVFGIVICQLNKEGNTLGSEGIKRATDQHYKLFRCDDNNELAYMEMELSRYTAATDIGSAEQPALRLNPCGPYFEEI